MSGADDKDQSVQTINLLPRDPTDANETALKSDDLERTGDLKERRLQSSLSALRSQVSDSGLVIAVECREYANLRKHVNTRFIDKSRYSSLFSAPSRLQEGRQVYTNVAVLTSRN